MSSRYSFRSQVPLNESSPVRATRVWNPFVPLRATSKPLSGFKTYTVALSLRRGGSALRANWISRSRGSGSILLVALGFCFSCALATSANIRPAITTVVLIFLTLISFLSWLELFVLRESSRRLRSCFHSLGALLHPLIDLLPSPGHALAVVIDDQSEPGVMELDQRAVF